MEALRVWPTIDQDVIHECTQRKERECDKHIAVIAMFNLAFYMDGEQHYFQQFGLA